MLSKVANLAHRKLYTRSTRNKYHTMSGVLRVPIEELNLNVTLPSGQAFRWKRITTDLPNSPTAPSIWRGVFGNCLVTLDQSDITHIKYSSVPENPNLQEQLEDYFQLKYKLSELYTQWGAGPSNGTPQNSKNKLSINEAFKQASRKLIGMRLLRQDPHECLFSFICSQNNNIKRISGMIDRLCQKYGTLIAEVDGDKYYSFPTLEQLEHATESELNALGFGYRSKYIVAGVQHVKQKGGLQWLLSLRSQSREDVQKALLEMYGIGRKVADCVALFSLDKFDVVPVDTHVWQIARRYMGKASKPSATLTPALYAEIGNWFKAHFGTHAGWAHSILFAAELNNFKDLISEAPDAGNESDEDDKAAEGQSSNRRKKRAKSLDSDIVEENVKRPKRRASAEALTKITKR